MPVLIVPLLSSVTVGLTMIFVVGTPFTALNNAITNFLNNLSGVNSAVLGLILGAMMAIDLAGPIGKAAYFFGVASLTTLTTGQTAPVMAGRDGLRYGAASGDGSLHHHCQGQIHGG